MRIVLVVGVYRQGGGEAMAVSLSLKRFGEEADCPEAERRAWKGQEQGTTFNKISWYLEMWKHRAGAGKGRCKALEMHLLLRRKGQNVPEGHLGEPRPPDVL